MIRSILQLALVLAAAFALRAVPTAPNAATSSLHTVLAIGLLLVAAILVGRIAHRIRFPHLTGYLLCGLAFGPSVFGLISQGTLADLTPVKGTAVGLIGLLAGCALNLRQIRAELRAIAAISLGSMLAAGSLLFFFFFWVTGELAITAAASLVERVAIALLAANVLITFSPAVAVAVISETRARGPFSRLCMSIVVLADLVIVLLFAGSSAFARNVATDSAESAGLGVLLMNIVGSILVGSLAGAVLAWYARRVRAMTGLVVFAILFAIATAGRSLHLDPLLAGLSAGLFLENLSAVSGEEVVRATERVTIPTFAIFFAVIGAEIHVRSFLAVAPFALGAAVLRAMGIFAGTAIGASVVRLPTPLARKVPFGLLPQAGVSLALASLVLDGFSPWGRMLGTILLGTIVVNELIGPVLFRFALARAGEIPSEPAAESSTHGKFALDAPEN